MGPLEKGIKAIDKTTVNQICSGQVILSLATAVKELVENSLDAGGTTIQVRLKEYGSESIEVIDNGIGVEEDNFQGLTLKHHTSKLQNFTDLPSVETFGFRGEALSSLCSLAKVSITTRHIDAVVGTKLTLDHNGVIIQRISTARPVGTSVVIDNIFCTLPVRQKEFLRNLKREFGKMCNIVQAYALLNVHCSMTITNRLGGKVRPVMETRAGTLRNNISSIFGSKQLNNILEISSVAPTNEDQEEFRCSLVQMNVKVTGFISSCMHGSGRSSPDRQYLYINGRPVDSSKMSRLVNELYHHYNNHQNPFFVLDIRVESESVDVNVVPDKRRILLEQEGFVLATIKASLRQIFDCVPSSMVIQSTRLNSAINAADCETGSEFGLARFLAPGATPPRPFSPINRFSNKKTVLKQSGLGTFLTTNSTLRDDSVGENNSTDEDYLPDSKKLKLDITLVEPLGRSKPIVSDCSSILGKELEGSKKSGDIVLELRDDVFKEPISEEDGTENLSYGHENRKEDLLPSETRLEITVESSKLPENIGTTALESGEDLLNSHSNYSSVEKPFVTKGHCGNPLETITIDDGLAEGTKKSRKIRYIDINLEKIKDMRIKKVNEAKKSGTVRFFARIDPSTNQRAEDELRRELDQSSFVNMQILGQFNRGFIITLLASDLFIIDQHATDEKYNFEKLSNEKMKSQPLTLPLPLRLTADKEEFLQDKSDIIRANGFDFTLDVDKDSGHKVCLTSVPVTKGIPLGPRDIDEILFLLEDAPAGQMCRPSRVRDILASRACRMSIMVGTALKHQEMRRLVQHMGEMSQPWNCPHGRPTIRHLLSLDLLSNST